MVWFVSALVSVSSHLVDGALGDGGVFLGDTEGFSCGGDP